MKKRIHLTLTALIIGTGLFAQISVFPNVTDFETQTLCGTSCTGSCNPTGTWRNADQFGFPQAGTDWLVEDGSTPSTATGPDIDHTIGTATGKYMYTESSGCNNVTAHLVSDIFDFSALTQPKLRFYYHMLGATMGTMHVDVDTTGLGNWVLDVTPSWTDNVNTWQQRDVVLGAYAGRPSVRIRIRAMTGTSFTSDMAVDDITVYQPLADDINMYTVNAGGGCGNSVNTPVTINMINMGSNAIPASTSIPVSFEINSVVVTETMITSVSIPASDTFAYTFTTGFADLSGPTAVFITAWSAWTPDLDNSNDTATVTTFGIPIISTFPYYEDFESGQNGWLINNGTLGTWAFGTPAKTTIIGASSGVNAFVTGGLGTGFYNDLDNSFVEGPCFDFSNICDPVISLRVWWNAEFSWDGMNVTISTDGGATWTLVGAFGDPLTWYTDNTIAGAPGGFQDGWSGRASTTNGSGGWVTARHRLVGAGNMANVKIRINFGTDGSVTDDGAAFDDIRVFNGTDLGADQTVCSPATVNLNAYHGNAAATYLWSTGATTDAIVASTTGWYSVAITASGICTVTDSVYIVVIDANSAPALGVDTSTCATAVPLDAGYWPGSTYLWSGGDTTQTISAAVSGTYIASVTTPCGVIADTIVINVNPLPVVNLGNDSTFCGSATLVAGTGVDTYLWNTSETTATITTTTSGIYNVAVVNTFGCSNADTIAVVVNALPAIAVTGSTEVCGTTSGTTLTATGATTYVWENGPSTDVNTVYPVADSSFIVTGTDANGCSNNDTVTVIVHALPVVTLGNDSAQCAGTITLDAGVYVSYLWNNGDTTQTTTTPADGSYYVVVTDTNNCTANSDTVMLTFYQLPYVYLGADTTVCGGPVTLDAGVQAAYLWSNTDVTQTTVVSTTGNYSVMVTDTNGCSNNDTVMVTINTPPTVALSLAFSTVCVDDGSYALTGATPAGGTFSGTGVTGSSFSPTTAGNGTHVISYSFTDANGCTDVATQSVTVNACVGYQENFAGAALSVYPNPSAGVFTLELNGLTTDVMTIVVMDAEGRLVIEEQVNSNAGALRKDLDLSTLDNGIYFLVLRSADASKTVKLVLNR